MPISELELLLRLCVSVVLGSLIGYEREWRDQPAGLRTHLLVTLASATFMLVSSQFAYYQHYDQGDLIRVDGSRIASNVVVGIGFLGGGAIIQTGLRIKGLTTAASLWLAAAVGLTSGAGMYWLAIITTATALFALVVLRQVEKRLRSAVVVQVRVDTDGGVLTRAELERLVRPIGASLLNLDQSRNVSTNSSRLRVDLRLPAADREEALLAAFEGLTAVRRLRIRHIET
jgi:putative Mg2+ transporter-C (MgtC) family protein